MVSRITILSYGTRGDVQPLLVLAEALVAAGFEVTLGADAEFERVVASSGATFAPLRLDLRTFLASERGRQASRRTRRMDNDTFETMVRPMLDDCWNAARDADALIYDTMLVPAYHIAEKLAIPSMMTSTMPNMTPTGDFPLIGAPRLWRGRVGNRLSYQLYRLSWWRGQRPLRRWCQSTLGLSSSRFPDYWRRHGKRIPVLHSYSPLVVPSPADWPNDTFASGYWFPNRDREWRPSPDLDAFLASGTPPVYLGFGSMSGLSGTAMVDDVVAAVRHAGHRAVVATGWGEAVTPQADVFVVDEVPHEWLFPRVSAVVHHGGAGTTAAALRFGRPSVICPLVTDQFFWGRIVADRGWGPEPVPQRTSSVASLTAAIERAIGDTDMQAAVERIGAAIRAEDGPTRAVDFVRAHLAS